MPQQAPLVGDWVFDEKIGRGSFAVVWKAHHRTTGQVVAVKEIATDKLNQKLKQSLECEISILKRVEHRNIVRLLDTREVTLPAHGLCIASKDSYQRLNICPGNRGSARLPLEVALYLHEPWAIGSVLQSYGGQILEATTRTLLLLRLERSCRTAPTWCSSSL